MLAFWEACHNGDLHAVQCAVQDSERRGSDSDILPSACEHFGLRLALVGEHFDVAKLLLPLPLPLAPEEFEFAVDYELVHVLSLLLKESPATAVTMFKWLLDETQQRSVFIAVSKSACYAGNLEVCQWLHSQGLWNREGLGVESWNDDCFQSACCSGNMELVCWVWKVWDMSPADMRPDFLGSAIASGNLELVHWLHARMPGDMSEDDILIVTANAVFETRNCDALHWWLGAPRVLQTLQNDPAEASRLAAMSCHSGHLAPVEAMYEYMAAHGLAVRPADFGIAWTEDLLYTSSLELVQWMHTVIVPQFSPNDGELYCLRRQYRPEVVRWMHASGIPVTATCACVMAWDSTQLEAVQVMCELFPMGDEIAENMLFETMYLTPHKSANALPVIRWILDHYKHIHIQPTSSAFRMIEEDGEKEWDADVEQLE
jgi:hypothetical protein